MSNNINNIKSQKQKLNPYPNRTNKRNNRINLSTRLTGNLLHVMGINVNQTVRELDIILSNKQSVEQLKRNIAEFIDITNPLVDQTINKIIEKWDEGIKKMGQNLSMSVVEFIPVLGQIIAEINSIQLIFSNFLGIFKSTGDIVNTTLNSASRKYYRRIAAAQNVVTAPIKKINNKIVSAQNVVANTVTAPIKLAQNSLAENLQSTENALAEKGNITGGAKILSRIQKSVKNFMGKNTQVTNTNTNRKITKTSKNVTMKGGGYNQNSIISQKGGQILSRINESLKTFNRM